MLDALRRELPPTLRLAGPVVAAELGWMAMGLVDTMMVGRVSATAIGAVSIGGMLFYTVAVFAAGLMLGLDTLVSQSFGAGDLPDCHRSLLNAVYLYLPLAPLIMLLVWRAGPFLAAFGVEPQVAREANSYLRAVAWGSLPLLLYFALRRYLQGMHLVRPVMFALISANLVHIAANWVLIYGNWGIPALGATGAGWATCFSRVYMTACLLLYTVWHERRFRTGWRDISLRPDWRRMSRLLRLGIPAGFQISLEVGVFAAATALAGRLTPATLAAHQIALNCASFTYMVPLGIGSAAAVRVGNAIGRRNPTGARRAGWTAILLAVPFMASMGLLFWAVPRAILRIFTTDAQVIEAGVMLLFIAALFQLFDGVQTVSIGALRGLGDTHTPMLCNLIGYWGVGLPLGYWLCFSRNWGAPGLWAGLCVALIGISAALLNAWVRKSNAWIRKSQVQ
ncbi:MAG: MATE family efflux transporter [Acidobacteriota bacterium]|nr:MATE family efflux transporter [Acidobacteriota bacterium]